jgi:CDGSH-type Zn-finger protein
MGKGKIVISKNGPYLVSGKIPLCKEIAEIGSDRQPERWAKGAEYPLKEGYSLCRCGQSKKKPFCDGMHGCVNFDGTETAGRQPFAVVAKKFEGPEIDLADAEPLCSGARFCDAKGTIWNLVARSNDPTSKETAIREACNCPSGRLVAYEKTGMAIEPNFEPSISLIEDPQAEASGPIWVKGGIEIQSEDGRAYETRNRVTLCRCGKSRNMPLCDGSHIGCGFSDGDESVKK